MKIYRAQILWSLTVYVPVDITCKITEPHIPYYNKLPNTVVHGYIWNILKTPDIFLRMEHRHQSVHMDYGTKSKTSMDEQGSSVAQSTY